MALTLTSPAFTDGSAMPPRYTGDGEDVSPPLAWHGAPDTTQAFALIADDPDCPDPRKPQRTWVHWVVADIPAGTTSLPEAASGRVMPSGAVEGRNDSNDVGYSGPYPPIGKHRYFFKLYALDRLVHLTEGHTKAELLRAIEGHVIATAQLMGTYDRS
jgi:Raf kinase inhibitor-like YbhB/YbcL family protein